MAGQKIMLRAEQGSCSACPYRKLHPAAEAVLLRVMRGSHAWRRTWNRRNCSVQTRVSGAPACPELRQPRPEDTVSWPFDTSLQNDDLLPERKVLGDQRRPA